MDLNLTHKVYPRHHQNGDMFWIRLLLSILESGCVIKRGRGLNESRRYRVLIFTSICRKKFTLSSTTLPFGTVWSNYSVHMYLVINWYLIEYQVLVRLFNHNWPKLYKIYLVVLCDFIHNVYVVCMTSIDHWRNAISIFETRAHPEWTPSWTTITCQNL